MLHSVRTYCNSVTAPAELPPGTMYLLGGVPSSSMIGGRVTVQVWSTEVFTLVYVRGASGFVV